MSPFQRLQRLGRLGDRPFQEALRTQPEQIQHALHQVMEQGFWPQQVEACSLLARVGEPVGTPLVEWLFALLERRPAPGAKIPAASIPRSNPALDQMSIRALARYPSFRDRSVSLLLRWLEQSSEIGPEVQRETVRTLAALLPEGSEAAQDLFSHLVVLHLDYRHTHLRPSGSFLPLEVVSFAPGYRHRPFQRAAYRAALNQWPLAPPFLLLGPERLAEKVFLQWAGQRAEWLDVLVDTLSAHPTRRLRPPVLARLLSSPIAEVRLAALRRFPSLCAAALPR